MLTLASKLKREEGVRAGRTSAGSNDASHRVSIRDRLLIKEVAELESNLPNTCKVTFPDENKLCHFQLAISPDEGYYLGGKFQFEIEVPEAYNMVVQGYLELAVDVGCGSGQGTELLAPYFLTVVGIDVSRAQLEIADAEEHAPNVCYRESPAEDLPFEDQSVDLVTSFAAAHWFDHLRFLGEADRILKPGGCLAVLSYTMDFELEYEDKSLKLNEICQEFYAALHPYRKSYIGSSSLQVYKNLFDSVSYTDKLWHECLRSRTFMSVSRFIGLIESFATYQGFLERDPTEARRLSSTITDRLLEEMGTSSTDTEVMVVVKYFYFLASKPETS